MVTYCSVYSLPYSVCNKQTHRNRSYCGIGKSGCFCYSHERDSKIFARQIAAKIYSGTKKCNAETFALVYLNPYPPFILPLNLRSNYKRVKSIIFRIICQYIYIFLRDNGSLFFVPFPISYNFSDKQIDPTYHIFLQSVQKTYEDQRLSPYGLFIQAPFLFRTLILTPTTVPENNS